ncbi:hypothetical protein CGZ96_07570 [Enemella evansiae]|nr:lysophospholipid acyltransferase family protein [Enemella evansiae]OYN99099.1 hypothetical protein CGZ96_07570 [Enemella evansiae]
MSSPDPQPRQLARWARGGARRPRLWPRLRADLRKVSGVRGWDGPGEPAPAPAPRAPRAPLPTPAAVVQAVGSLTNPRGLRAEGGDPARLPSGGVLLVANHPTAAAARLVLARLPWARRVRTSVVAAPIPAGRFDRLAQRLRDGGTVLVFPEGPPSADGGLGEFGDDAVRLATRSGAQVVPVGIRGALSAGGRERRGVDGRARVGVRLGDPLTGAGLTGAAEQRAAVQALLTEDAETWWQVQRRSDPVPAEQPHGWRQTWAQTAPARRGGMKDAPRIWR